MRWNLFLKEKLFLYKQKRGINNKIENKNKEEILNISSIVSLCK
jgi:hypothetical protein